MSERTDIAIGILGSLIVKNAMASKQLYPTVFYLTSVPGNFNAITLPPFGIFINARHQGNKMLLQHELIHWRQYQQMGLLSFYLEYITQYLRYGYDRMPLEVAARIYESAYCRQNYTACVRSGQARTIHNPKFRTL